MAVPPQTLRGPPCDGPAVRNEQTPRWPTWMMFAAAEISAFSCRQVAKLGAGSFQLRVLVRLTALVELGFYFCHQRLVELVK